VDDWPELWAKFSQDVMEMLASLVRSPDTFDPTLFEGPILVSEGEAEPNHTRYYLRVATLDDPIPVFKEFMREYPAMAPFSVLHLLRCGEPLDEIERSS
jgi:hypothetical protein